ncbi:hypothetical protein A2313_04990 [Candidatus Roizmanbacteria bacterium RIFOXYB2_FULL_41_10]|uniref:Uncharacterized protein n=1 Tax=Candidatus Roizmanbacteria bacterium RIFOXYA1_FULL_41_12 TaxID=1802082 RepID=A0A1F7KFL8_9BACT|nr:MAG: hypothetical protein A2209_00065 [Candidatus Roizmanbacteria bacterium RIFOXYA1_FULL_41_12]OGK67637.1 MAG: hypothetical protein A2377_00700 [Candidatus Roizmanbacteria bacterium RIFOXYB1_FULL_41_27]OGK67891.1 MAG: hypothetical protein A2262_00680 [Candidatus Roizmanbacteria bacterium RIFOXYA2_FULL_41_8]OGK69360.1 MAG: hypothetical protein A2313_04990 [Candidatus Roizmanbacteria bacterium RIFOXYB2_FULL_41_10]OGK71359.1 MAG: hypothetical protein A2403_01085 [Candidatus Roizmanbacteria bac
MTSELGLMPYLMEAMGRAYFEQGEIRYPEYLQIADQSNIPTSFNNAFLEQFKLFEPKSDALEDWQETYTVLALKLLGKNFTISTPIIDINVRSLNQFAITYCLCIAHIKELLELKIKHQATHEQIHLLLSPLTQSLDCNVETIMENILQLDITRDAQYNDVVLYIQQILDQVKEMQDSLRIHEQKVIQEIGLVENVRTEILSKVPNNLKQKLISTVVQYVEDYFGQPKNVNRIMLLGTSKK